MELVRLQGKKDWIVSCERKGGLERGVVSYRGGLSPLIRGGVPFHFHSTPI